MLEEQPRLNEWFNKLNINSLPQCFMLLGDFGCGKHTLAKDISDKLLLDYVDITDKIENDLIQELSLRQVPTLYVIYIDELTERCQNLLLKFIEEPKSSKFVCILCDNINRILPTVKNRCIIYTFEKYSNTLLEKYISQYFDTDNKELATLLFTTIGQIKKFTHQNLIQLKDLCDKMLTKMGGANIQNTLTIADKLNYKDLYDKYDISLFFKMLGIECVNYSKQDSKYIKYYKLIQEYCNRISNNNKLKKQDLIENFLINLWKEAREVN